MIAFPPSKIEIKADRATRIIVDFHTLTYLLFF